jgi:hypothetical protein
VEAYYCSGIPAAWEGAPFVGGGGTGTELCGGRVKEFDVQRGGMGLEGEKCGAVEGVACGIVES